MRILVAIILISLSVVAFAKDINISITGPIKQGITSLPAIVIPLNQATENDTVYLHINSPGGSVNVGEKILNAMKHSKAKEIVAVIDGKAASMAAVISLASDRIVFKQDSCIMIHTVRVTYSVDFVTLSKVLGDEKEVAKWKEYIDKEHVKYFNRVFELNKTHKIFNDKHFEEYNAGKDVWVCNN